MCYSIQQYLVNSFFLSLVFSFSNSLFKVFFCRSTVQTFFLFLSYITEGKTKSDVEWNVQKPHHQRWHLSLLTQRMEVSGMLEEVVIVWINFHHFLSFWKNPPQHHRIFHQNPFINLTFLYYYYGWWWLSCFGVWKYIISEISVFINALICFTYLFFVVLAQLAKNLLQFHLLKHKKKF